MKPGALRPAYDSQPWKKYSPVRRLQRLAWSLNTLWQKQRIAFEDQLHLFPYQRWIETVERAEVQKTLKESNRLGTELPEVTFVVSAEQASVASILATLGSLHKQTGNSWSLALLIAKNNALLRDPTLLRLLNGKLRVCILETKVVDERNAWPGEIQQLSGEWIVPLSPGDQVSPVWMDIFRLYLFRNKGADILYWDEDVCQQGTRVQPFFKPDWSPELLFSRNYLRTAAFRKLLVQKVLPDNGTTRAGWIFAVVQAAQKVVHIPFVLQSLSLDGKLSPQENLRVHGSDVRAHLENCGYLQVDVNVSDEGALRVRWSVDYPPVSIIIPTKNNLTYLKRCLTSLLEKTDYPAYEILLMDDQSTDPAVKAYYQELTGRHRNIRIHQNEGTFNYSRVNNQGARLTNERLLLFLNNDVEILHADWLQELVRWVLRPGVGMVGAKLLYPDHTIQHAGIVLGMTGHASHIFAGKSLPRNQLFVSPDEYRNVSSVTGACMLVRREAFEETGGFDEDLGLVFNDVELSLRFLRSGWRVVYTPAAKLIHYEGRSRARYIPRMDIRMGAERLRSFVEQGDPFYNPNLSLSVVWPTLRRAFDPSPAQRLVEIARHKG